MNLQEYKQRPVWWKITRSNHDNLGEICQQEHYTNNKCLQDTVKLKGLGKYRLPNLQEVVPEYSDGEWKPKKIVKEYLCVGDTLEEDTVWGYTWSKNFAEILPYDQDNNLYEPRKLCVNSHTPMHPTADKGHCTECDESFIGKLDHEKEAIDIAERLRDIADLSNYEYRNGWTPLNKRIRSRLLNLADELEDDQE